MAARGRDQREQAVRDINPWPSLCLSIKLQRE